MSHARTSDRSTADRLARGAGAAGALTEKVVWLDPGDYRTGIAWATMRPGRISTVGQLVLNRREAIEWLAEQQDLEGRGAKRRFDRVGWETWIPRPRPGTKDMNWIRGNPLLSARGIGGFELVCWFTNTPIKTYGPDRKDVFLASMRGSKQADKIRRRIDSSTEQHDKDALMHLWGYAFENWEVAGK